MRNLKKVLALVLALMMTVSLMVTASASDYTDDGSIEKTEAVEVMSMINVFQGTDGGNFDPAGNLTRAQAAKIISYMKLGAAVADVLPKDSAPFDDVKADRWYTGYVTYVKSEGIINGRSDKVFDPNGNVTGYEFGKMALEAAGISGEYSGTSAWQLNVNLALRGKNPAGTDLMEGVGAVLADPITREQACQLAFNALNYTESGATTGKWIVKDKGDDATKKPGIPASVKFDSYADAVQTVKNLKAEAVIGTNFEVEAEKNNAGSLAATVFSLKSETSTDKFGAPAVKWTAGDKSVTVADAASKSYEKTTGKTVKADLKLEGTINAVIVTDGKAAESAELTDATALGGNGATVDVYKVDDTNLKIIVVNTYVGTIKAGSYKAADEAKKVDEQVTITLGSVKSDVITGDDAATQAVFKTSKFTKDDEKATVLYTVKVTSASEIEIVSADIAAEASGTVTRTSGSDGAQTFVMNGETYKWSAMAEAPGLAATKIGKEVTVYLDKAGHAIKEKAGAEVIPDYAVVVAAGENNTGWSGEETYKVKLLLLDGSIVEKDVAAIDDGENDPAAPEAIDDVEELLGLICTYTDTDDGIVVAAVAGANLVTIAAKDDEADGALAKIVRNQPDLVTGAVANKDTVFLIANAKGVVTVYTGISAVPSIQVAVGEDGEPIESADDFQIAVDANGIAKVVYVAASQPVEDDVTSTDVIFVIGSGALSADETGEYKEYPAVINGEIKTLLATKTADLDAGSGKLFKAVKENTKGLVTEGTAMGTSEKALADDGAAVTGITAPAGGNVKIGAAEESKSYVYGENTKVYVYADGEITESAVEDIETDATASVFGYTDKDGVLAALFIVPGDGEAEGDDTPDEQCEHENVTWDKADDEGTYTDSDGDSQSYSSGDHIATCGNCDAGVVDAHANTNMGFEAVETNHVYKCKETGCTVTDGDKTHAATEHATWNTNNSNGCDVND